MVPNKYSIDIPNTIDIIPMMRPMRAMSFCEIRLVAKARALGGVGMGRTIALDAATATLMSTVGVPPMTLSLQLISSKSRRSITPVSEKIINGTSATVYELIPDTLSKSHRATVRINVTITTFVLKLCFSSPSIFSSIVF